MRDACRIEPLVAVDLVVADDVADAVGENLRAAARERIHARSFQLFERFANRKLGALGEIGHFHHREGLEMDLRKALLEA